jgi:hypothetical protein
MRVGDLRRHESVAHLAEAALKKLRLLADEGEASPPCQPRRLT